MTSRTERGHEIQRLVQRDANKHSLNTKTHIHKKTKDIYATTCNLYIGVDLGGGTHPPIPCCLY